MTTFTPAQVREVAHDYRLCGHKPWSEAADLLDQFAALLERSAWQPIDKAPKDGTPVRLRWRSVRESGPNFEGVGRWYQGPDGSSGWTGQSYWSDAAGAWSTICGSEPTAFKLLDALPPVPVAPARTET